MKPPFRGWAVLRCITDDYQWPEMRQDWRIDCRVSARGFGGSKTTLHLLRWGRGGRWGKATSEAEERGGGVGGCGAERKRGCAVGLSGWVWVWWAGKR